MASLAAVENDPGNSGGLWLTPDKPALEAGYRVNQGLWVGSAFSLKPHIWRMRLLGTLVLLFGYWRKGW